MKTDETLPFGTRERDIRRADALDSILLAVLEADTRQALLERLSMVLMSAASAAAVLLRVRRDDGQWLPAVSFGVDAGFAASFAPPIEARWRSGPLPEAPFSLARKEAERDLGRDLLDTTSANAVLVLPLTTTGTAAAIAYLLQGDEQRVASADHELLALLGARAAAAIAHRATLDELQGAVRSRDDVLSVVAHDLQNPITVISIAANMLLKRSPDATARRPVERILRASQRADRMIRDLLEVNAIESGRFSIERSRIQPADLILSVLESQLGLAADASVIIATDVAPELPAIEADEERLLEVLENLIGNAVKFTSPGGTITVSATHRDSDILVSVRDTGSGIAPEQMPHIFDRFWQATKAHRRGTGLGLTICKAIVEAHGGRIWAESALGKGTTMCFTIPASTARGHSRPAHEVANILLVDDRPENLFALSAILERPDYRLVTANSGEEALRVALREHFAVALIDVAMPGMNGLEVAVHLKDLERSRDIPIIFVTAFGDDPEEIHRAYSAGGVDYLVKPLDADIVRKKVAVFVDLSRKRRADSRRVSPTD